MNEEKQVKSGKIYWLIGIIVVVIILILWQTGNLGARAGRGDAYQAVFVTNGQVYFGRLSNADDQYARLKDVYYLQVTQALQPPDQTQPVTNLNLIKLGGEIHGPLDPMFINRDHILFWEDLKPDSQVVQAIQQSKQSQQPQP